MFSGVINITFCRVLMASVSALKRFRNSPKALSFGQVNHCKMEILVEGKGDARPFSI